MSRSAINRIYGVIGRYSLSVSTADTIPFGIPDRIRPFIHSETTLHPDLQIEYRKRIIPPSQSFANSFRIHYDHPYHHPCADRLPTPNPLRIDLDYCGQSLQFDPVAGTGIWSAADSDPAVHHLDNNGFFFAFSLLHLLNYGYAFHGVGFRFRNYGIIALGHSGSGKSTIRNLLNDQVDDYGDDGIFIQDFHLVPSPFYQYVTDPRMHLQSPVPLKLCLLLHQDTCTYLEKPDCPDWVLRHQLERLFHFAPVFMAGFEQRINQSLDALIRHIPCLSLHFSHRKVQILELLDRYFDTGQLSVED